MTQRVECLIKDERWEKIEILTLATRALRDVFAHFDIQNQTAELSILACDNARISELNATYRQKNTPTNILAWPSIWHERALGMLPDFSKPRPVELGDLALAYEQCTNEAHDARISLSDHVTHLIVHGILHLLGFDHEDDMDCIMMERAERLILSKMGVCLDYKENSQNMDAKNI